MTIDGHFARVGGGRGSNTVKQMDVEGELYFPPINGRVNIIFPSSSADKFLFQSGLVAFPGVNGRVGLDAAVEY